MCTKNFTLVGPDGKLVSSTSKGAIGGNRRLRIYGRLNCPNALRHIANGGYAKNRVFFADEETAKRAGYRPCAVCMPIEYVSWKNFTSIAVT